MQDKLVGFLKDLEQKKEEVEGHMSWGGPYRVWNNNNNQMGEFEVGGSAVMIRTGNLKLPNLGR